MILLHVTDVASLAGFVILTFRLKTLFKFLVYFTSTVIYDWITIMGYSNHEFMA